MSPSSVGESIPSDTSHAVSVSLPTWAANIGYEEGEKWVVSKMKTGYPRFFIHKSIAQFAEDVVADHGKPGQVAFLFPTAKVAGKCLQFMQSVLEGEAVGVEVLHLDLSRDASSLPPSLASLSPTISVVILDKEHYSTAKQFWQHTGEGVSSRRAEFCHELYKQGFLQHHRYPQSPPPTPTPKGPRRYQRPTWPAEPACKSRTNVDDECNDSLRFLEERFGRNLDLAYVQKARSAIRRRIAGAMAVEDDDGHDGPGPWSIQVNSRGISNLGENDVHLFPCGMNAIFHVHQALLIALGHRKSINFGFPYVDTLKILEKFGPGCVFYGHASSADLDDLESRLESGEQFLALFCEFPGNPLLTCPDLKRIRQLADAFDFAVVVDETIGTFANVNVLQFADVVVSSLTKIFSGDCNVMGGSAILNPNFGHYHGIRQALELHGEDTYWPEDVVFMERNSRDFEARVDRINANAEAICQVLRRHESVKHVYYPKYNETRSNYDTCRRPSGGYGGLLSVVFKSPDDAPIFFDALNTAKGPSLGTNFTLTCPYVLLAHYQETEWASRFGVDASLVRVSVGLEETDDLKECFKKALDTIRSRIPHLT